MAVSLPYLTSPGTIDAAFKRMKDAATPQRVTGDFVKAVLQMKGGSGASIPPFLKRLGFLNSNGTPTPLYDRFRNESTSMAAVAEALRTGYKPLFQTNEFAHKLNDADFKGLVLQVTGLEKNNRVAQLIQQTWKKLATHANFDAEATTTVQQPAGRRGTEAEASGSGAPGRVLGLSYTINLNLPDTTNPEVFAAIFRSLKEHLLDG